MKVYMGPYKTWVGPYQIADILQYIGVSEDTTHKIGEYLSNTWLNSFCEWIESKRERKIKIKIHDYDVWSMDTTLSHIILPMLKRLRAVKHGSAMVEDTDVPVDLRGDTDDDIVNKWNYVLDEMIWTFEQMISDWESLYHSGNMDYSFVEQEGGGSIMVEGSNHSHVFDREGYNAHNKRITEGLLLFGKYFRNLWD